MFNNKMLIRITRVSLKTMDYPRPVEGEWYKVLFDKEDNYRCQNKDGKIYVINKKWHEFETYEDTRMNRLLYL